MPNEKLPEINEHDAEELIHYPQNEEQKERRSRLLPGRWTRRVQKSSARAQARRRVAEKTSEDHAYLMLGAVPFWAVGATSLQNGIILCAVLIILMLPCSALHLILRRKLNLAEWVALPLTVLVAAMLAAACCVALVLYWPGAFDSLGIYLFLLVAAPVLLQADSYTAVDNMREFWGHYHPGKRRPAGAFTPQYPAGSACGDVHPDRGGGAALLRADPFRLFAGGAAGRGGHAAPGYPPPETGGDRGEGG